MPVFPADLILGAKRAADKLSDPSIEDTVWLAWVSSAIGALTRKLVLAFPDAWVIPYDFAATATGLVSLPFDFQAIRGLDFNPTLTSRTEVRRYNFSNRDAGARVAGGSRYARVRYRIVGRNISLEPREYATGNYRLFYVQVPKTFRADLTVRLATTAELTPVFRTVANELDATAVGALVIDGVPAVLGDPVLLKDQSNQFQNGPYTVTDPGSAGTVYKLTRPAAYLEGTALPAAFAVTASEGVANTNKTFVTDASGNLFTAPLAHFVADNRTLDPRLEPYVEWLELYVAIKACTAKEDSNIGDLKQELAALNEDIDTMAESTDEAEADTVADVEGDDGFGPFGVW